MPTRPAIFKWRQTEPAIILCAVRWYLRYSLSLRNVEELLEERGLEADHTTVWRWVQRYGPELEKRLRRTLSPPTSPGASTRLTFASRAAGIICIGLSIQQVRPSISYGRPSATRMLPNDCFAKLCAIGRIHSLASSTRIWHLSIPRRFQLLRRKGLSAVAASTDPCST